MFTSLHVCLSLFLIGLTGLWKYSSSSFQVWNVSHVFVSFLPLPLPLSLSLSLFLSLKSYTVCFHVITSFSQQFTLSKLSKSQHCLLQAGKLRLFLSLGRWVLLLLLLTLYYWHIKSQLMFVFVVIYKHCFIWTSFYKNLRMWVGLTLPFKSLGSLRNVFIFQRKALFFQ